MHFLHDLFFNTSVTQSLLVLTFVIAVGIILGEKIRFKGMSLGVTWILFFGIFLAAVGIHIHPTVEHFAKDFGLVLFVYSIGLSVGPSFFSSLGKGGLKLNLMAFSIVLLAVACTIALKYLTGEDMATMIGVMSGAITNTPSLGAAQQAFSDIYNGASNPDIANGYAVAYPLAVVGIIFSIMLVKWIFRVNMEREENKLKEAAGDPNEKAPVCVDCLLTNPKVNAITIGELHDLTKIHMVVSRIIHQDGSETIARSEGLIHTGDTLRILTDRKELRTIELLGQVSMYEKVPAADSNNLVSRKIAVTKSEWQGQKIGKVSLHAHYNVTITRVSRAGVDLLATKDLALQLGDRLMVVGEEQDVQKVADLFGNQLKRLDAPNLVPVFLGIALGVIVGLLPIAIPGMSQPFKLGLAGGSLIVALLMGRFGPSYRMVTFATTSANMMLREVGLSLFLAAVGLGAGGTFVPAIMGGGYMWILYGLVITLVPLITVGLTAYKFFGVNYYTLMGLIAGSTTDPPALAYAMSQSANNDQASVAYATVYPLTMFLRVMAAQLMVLLLC